MTLRRRDSLHAPETRLGFAVPRSELLAARRRDRLIRVFACLVLDADRRRLSFVWNSPPSSAVGLKRADQPTTALERFENLQRRGACDETAPAEADGATPASPRRDLTPA